jgi:hypothetical protein
MPAFRQLRRKLKLDKGSLISLLPRPVQFALRYRSAHHPGRLVFTPTAFHEKLFYKRLFDRRPILAVFADKLKARDYVTERVGPEVLVKILATARRAEDLPFAQLPARFVLKANHGSGYVRIVKDKSQENEAELRRLAQGWLAENYGRKTGEWIYNDIPPTLMVEEFLDDGDGHVPLDYKFFVFAGQTFMIQVDAGRFINHRRDFYTPAWQRLDVRDRNPNIGHPVPRPAGLNHMLQIAAKLGAGIDFVRIDLYEVGDRICFGELTNFPIGGNGRFDPASFDTLLGAQWHLNGY